MNIDDMIRIYRDDGNHMLVRSMDNLFYQDPDLMKWRNYFENIGGFAQDSWYPMWDILIKELDVENFLDLGVHVGQFSVLPALLGKRCNKEFNIHMVSPFSGVGDKYSNYEQKDYFGIFTKALGDMMVDSCKFIPYKGLSQDDNIKDRLRGVAFDLMYIDGSHDYEVVKQDIEFYVTGLRPGGIVIFDDAVFYTPSFDRVQVQGYYDVINAVMEMMDNNSEFEHLFDLTHNRLFRRK